MKISGVIRSRVSERVGTTVSVVSDVQVGELRRVGDRLLENEAVKLLVERGLVVVR